MIMCEKGFEGFEGFEGAPLVVVKIF
jgi:hypothetical protein